jgi:glucose/arabinose dehydrogenase
MKTKALVSAILLSLGAYGMTLPAADSVSAQGLPDYTTITVSDDVQMPWGMVWLPDGDMLVTDRNGTIVRIRNGDAGEPLAGLPEIHVNGQGGLLDIALHPDYANTGWIYISYSSPEGAGEGSHTAIMRAKLEGNALVQQEVIYKGEGNTTRGQHYGGRISFDNDGYMFFSIGDRGDHFTNVQDLTRDGGKIYRINDDGSIPSDNPFLDITNAKTAIWSYGHRNPQGMDFNPLTGELWNSEHGPRGGDEINIARAGNNYGWPIVGYGINYNGEPLAVATSGEGMEQPLWYWDPSIAVSGIAFVKGDVYPELKNHLLVGSLRGTTLELLEIHDDKIIRRTEILAGAEAGRIRNVRQGPDGYIYLGVEGAGIKRLIPAE